MTQQPEEKHVTKVIVLLDTLMRLSLPNGPPLLMSVEKPKKLCTSWSPGHRSTRLLSDRLESDRFRESFNTEDTEEHGEVYGRSVSLCPSVVSPFDEKSGAT